MRTQMLNERNMDRCTLILRQTAELAVIAVKHGGMNGCVITLSH